MAKHKVRLFADVHLPIKIVIGLRRLGYDVKTVLQYQGTSEPEPGLSDQAILSIAMTERRAVITSDSDFQKLHFENPNHQGIILCAATLEYRKRAKEIDEAIKDHPPLLGKLIYVPSKQDE
jgi:predicted nuclease of predicted toxin-antitoxin system